MRRAREKPWRLQSGDAEGRSLFWAEEGFSTVGMALALLITLSLVFTCARVYEVNTASAQVQEVADAAVLSAENMVGEFYIVVTICDALTFTLSLAMLVTLALGVVCACVPPAAALSKTLLSSADKLRHSRDSFYDSAQESLSKLQQALPFIATAQAQEVLAANSVNGHSYQGVVVLAPWEGSTAGQLSFEGSDEALATVQDSHTELLEAAADAEGAAQKANEWKLHAYEHDSGSREAYCMYERAQRLAGLSGVDNPFFSSVDTWDFSAALKRAQTYYQARWRSEAPQGSSVDELANSALRKRFYAYAAERVGEGYVHEDDGSFDALFPLLPKNTDEMRATTLYTDAVYPVTRNAQGTLTMHAWEGCPGKDGMASVGAGALRDMDGNPLYETCSQCRFAPSSMGKVAAASSSIENGFEYHYNEVARAAQEYEKARDVLDPLAAEVKDTAGGLFDVIESALSEVCAKRIDLVLPGSIGAVALVVDSSAPNSRFPSSFVSGGGVESLGVRAALSSSTLVRESSDEGKNVLTSFLDGVDADGSAVLGGASVALEVWSGCLEVYAQGHDALVGVVGDALGGLPLAGASGLGSWASDALEDAIAEVGFDPPDLSAHKAVLVNSVHVLEADDSGFSARLLAVKRQVVASGGDGGMEGALSAIERAALDAVDDVSAEFEVATIVLFDGALEVPLTVALPSAVEEGLAHAVQSGIDALRSMATSITGVRQWR